MMKNNQSVICINDDFSNVSDKKGIRFPKFGVTYTVRSEIIIDGKAGLLLHEIVNPKFIFTKHGNKVFEPPFEPARFILMPDKEDKRSQPGRLQVAH